MRTPEIPTAYIDYRSFTLLDFQASFIYPLNDEEFLSLQTMYFVEKDGIFLAVGKVPRWVQ